jgi:uncharacterized protein YkwD
MTGLGGRWCVGAATCLILLAGASALVPAQGRVPTAAAAGPCDVDSSKLTLDSDEQAAFDAISNYRVSQGKPALARSTVLERIALWKSTDMAANVYAAHDDLPLGRSYDQRIADCGYTASTIAYGENLAGCDPSGAATVAQWKESSEHNANMLNGEYLYAGIKRVQGAAPNGAAGRCWYWSLELGSLPDSALAGAGGPSTSNGAPAAPQPTATAENGQTILLQWAPVIGASGYGIYNGTDGVMLDPVARNVGRLTVSNLSPGTYYCFMMYAYSNAGTSAWSSWACAYTQS